MEDTDGTVKNVTGNTRIRSRGWTFTLNNPENNDGTQMAHLFKTLGVKFLFQEETGELGTKHFQGVIYYNNPVEWNTVKQLDNRIHWEKCKNVIASLKYCSKSETRTGNIWNNGFDNYLPVKSDFDFNLASDWQLNILNMIKNPPDKRKIYWYWSKLGSVGKTTLAKHICLNNNKALYVNGNCKDILYAAAKNKPEIVIFGIPRDKENYVSYNAIESLKDGIYFSSKYESDMVIMKSPHIIIMANFEPDMSKLSIDRWEVINVDR